MPSSEGCQLRRARLLKALQPTGPLVFMDALSLRYLANFAPDPFSLGADYGGVLVLSPNGDATLYYDQRVAKTSVQAVHVSSTVAVPWYDGQTPGHGARRWILHESIAKNGGRVHDSLTDTDAARFWDVITEIRRQKDADEIDTIRQCCRCAEAGLEWARKHVKPGMTELDVYLGIFAQCSQVAGQAVIVYGDFAVSPGSQKRGGPPTNYVIQTGETLILDFSVVIQGYRSDFTNTLVVGAKPTAEQQKIFDYCVAAMEAGEAQLKPGAKCQTVYDAVADVFVASGMKEYFPHHAGHGLGISHPEAPYFVAKSKGELLVGDVVTLEPGLYVDGIGGIRIEHNYVITPTGYERLSQHDIILN